VEKSDIEKLNQLENFLSFIQTWAFKRFVRLPNRIIALFTGNQSMKTSSTAYQYVMRIFGIHPVPKRNVLYLECSERSKLYEVFEDKHQFYDLLQSYLENHKSKDSATWGPYNYPGDMRCPECGADIIIHRRRTRIFRFASETLPTEKEYLAGDIVQSAEVSNTQYPEFKKWLPPFLIKKDITHRSSTITILDPLAGMKFGDITWKGSDIVVEFQSYSQTVQAGAGVQRLSCWCDEEPPFDFFEEQMPRLLAEDGDMIVSVTPAEGMSWTFDDLFEKAKIYVRTQAIVDYYREYENKEVKHYERTDSDRDIAVIQAATDDNPTLSPDVVEEMYANTPDPDGTVIPTRRYGIFKQATGRIFKDFTFLTHFIDLEKYGITREGIADWCLARTMDFHQENPHAICWVALSPTNEAFVYMEWNPSPGQWVMSRICEEMGRRSRFERYEVNLIDPLAEIKNPETRKSTVDDMNNHFHRLKMEGICAGGYWETYKTQGEAGRDAIKERLQNSLKCEKPFNNAYMKNGVQHFYPTLWISHKCRLTAESLRRWRLESWVSNKYLAYKDKKQKPAEKWSHFCTALEGLFKDRRFRPIKRYRRDSKPLGYFQGRSW